MRFHKSKFIKGKSTLIITRQSSGQPQDASRNGNGSPAEGIPETGAS